MNLLPATLEGEHVRLEPLRAAHHTDFCIVGLEAQIWRWTGTQPLLTADDMRNYIEAALHQQESGKAAPFAIVHKGARRAVGSTRYANIDVFNRSLEIGYTWVAPPWQRSAVNTETKYLLLRYAFETLGCIRVQLRTDALNERSRTAILRLGAKQEGIFRGDMITYAGRRRDSVYFGIIEDDWPQVKAQLLEKLALPRSAESA